MAPLSAYGRSKLAGEREVVAAGDRHVIARSSWLFGTNGSRDGTVRVVNDQIGCPTYTGHLAQGLLDLARGEATGVQHVAGAGATSWHGLAVEIFKQADMEVRVDPVTTAEMPRPARRPPYSVLASAREDGVSLPDWREGLEAYLARRSAEARA